MNNDLISRKALIEAYDKAHQGPPGGARKLMEEAPGVDAVEVVHGEWVEGGKTMVDDVKGRILHCSECGDYCYNFDPLPPHNYCPNCG